MQSLPIQVMYRSFFRARMDYNQYDCFIQNTYIINQNMQDQDPIAPISKKKTPFPFQCGCRSQFQAKSDFKDHSLRVHNAQYILNSTHFLTPYTLLVLPANQHKSKGLLSVSEQVALHLNKEQASPKGMVAAMQSSIVENTQFPSGKRRKSTNSNGRRATSEMMVQSSIKDKEGEEVEWNGFRLLKNPKVESNDFYCGKCLLIFTLPEQFIIHCLQVCQRLKYAKSSHFIVCDLPQTKTQQRQIVAIQLPFDRKETKKQSQNDVVNNKQIKDLIGKEVMQLFTTYSNRVETSYYCGSCQQTFAKSGSFVNHIREGHSEIVHPNSSHIILRRKRGAISSKVLYCYIPQEKQENQEEEKYHCCCKPEAKMSLNRLIKHTMEVHKGISPLYGQERIPLQPTQPIRSSTIHINNEEDPIYSILRKKMGHSTAPFTCYSCEMEFKQLRQYSKHLQAEISKSNPQIGSHVILKINTRAILYPIRSVSISAQQEWPIKDPIYYCPCQPTRMTMQDLVEHISTLHNCISPVYYGIVP